MDLTLLHSGFSECNRVKFTYDDSHPIYESSAFQMFICSYIYIFLFSEECECININIKIINGCMLTSN